MNPGQFLQAVQRYLDAPDPASPPILIQAATDLADMVSWAPGPIDPDGLFIERLQTLQGTLRARHEQLPDSGVAALHDALAELHAAIARHDGDLTAGDPADDTVDF